jgi:transketolase
MQVIKPLDTDAVNLAMKCKLIVTIEEHNHIGGLGSSVAEYMSEQEGHPRLVRIGVPDCFYTADVPNKLLENAGLDSDSIYKKIKDEYEKKVVSN